MRAVLDVETEAALDLGRCKDECQAALEAARMDARNTTIRAEAIARGIHGRIERVATARAELRRRSADEADSDANTTELAAAVGRLAARLTGNSS